MPYKVIRLTGDYKNRQEAANKAGAALYLEAHYNSAEGGDGTEVLVTDTSGSLTRRLAKRVAANISSVLVSRLRHDEGLKILNPKDRGYGNLAFAKPPAMIVEPCFVDEKVWAEKARANSVLTGLAIADAIYALIPEGSTIALSLGHKGRVSKPRDMGTLAGNGMWEADLAAQYLDALQKALEGDSKSSAMPVPPLKIPDVEPADQDPSPWAVTPWKWMESKGFMSGNPRGVVTREMFAVVLYRYHEEHGK